MYKTIAICTAKPHWDGCSSCDLNNTDRGQMCFSVCMAHCCKKVNVPVMDTSYTNKYRLDSMPHAQCHVEITVTPTGFISVLLVSYETPVVQLTSNGKMQRLWFGMTPTTARHINHFINEFLGCSHYYRFKELTYENRFLDVNCRDVIINACGYIRSGRKWNN